ncbi:single-stranded DNA-binding protein [Clostridia bacterium]|nr:single-stranded DNA-binding protein [Clostridia bacterium]
MNNISLIGRLTRDPQMNYTQNGKAVTNFSLAVDRVKKVDGKPTADFFRVTAWGKLGETIAKHCGKGQQIGITGSCHINNYTGSDLVERKSVDVVAREMTFCGPKGNKSNVKDDLSTSEGATINPEDFSDDGLPF